MKKFYVELNAQAFVKGFIFVDAETEEDAQKKAKERLGDVQWTYDGLNDEAAVEVTETWEEK